MFTYDTLSEAVSGLKSRGYTIDFNLDYDYIHCKAMDIALKPNEFEITEVYRFEGNSDPADESVIYAIESKHGQRGVLVNGFGVSSDAMSDGMIAKLRVRH